MFNNEDMYTPEHVENLLHAVGGVLSETIYSGNYPSLSPGLDLNALKKKLFEVRDSFRNGNVKDAFRGIVDGSVNLHHPGFFSQQLAAPSPMSAVSDMLVSVLNQGHAVFDMSPINSLIEEDVLKWVQNKLLLPDNYFGVVTSGGSASNLSALLAARNYIDQWATWENGKGGREIVVVASKRSHYSISKAVGIVGIGVKNIIYIEDDEGGRVEKNAFRDCIKMLSQRGVFPIVCLTISTTCTGSVDPIPYCVDMVHENIPDAWVHVDAAHGGFLSMTGRYPHIFEALSRCDSISWDAHKMLFQSIPLSFLFIKNEEKADCLSRHDSPYLTQRNKGDFLDRAKWSLDCSRRSNAVKLWCTLQYYGEDYFISAYKQILSCTDEIYGYLKSCQNYFVIGPPDSNILTFRYMTDGHDDEELNNHILSKVNSNANYLIGFTNINNRIYLRLTVINPRSTVSTVEGLLSEIEEIASLYLIRSEYGKR